MLETDRIVIPQKVCEAERAALARARELFYNGGTGEEKESLEDALYLLRAYRSAWDHADVSGCATRAAA
jgi:hypothetical protein